MSASASDPRAPDPRAIESLLAFWNQAGVDACLEEAPVDRMGEAARMIRAQAPAPAQARSSVPSPRAVAEAGPDIAAAVAQAAQAAAAAEDLDQLAAAIAAFDGCGLKREGARQSVFARGASDAPVMLIGEAPGADEDRAGLPFVGRAGQLLDKMLTAAGLMDRVFITNTVFWRPPGNRTPTVAEQAVCAPFLERAIALVRPGHLLLVGGAAAKAVLKQDQGILALRGRWLEWTGADASLTLPAMPTLHPAFLLRQPAAKAMAWSDMLTLAERVDRPDRPQ